MTIESFFEHVGNNDRPDPSWSRALQALWYAEKPDWDTAHTLCQQGNTPEDCWIHAHLHREEGDLGNARYWYQRAGKSEHKGTLNEERCDILAMVIPR